MRHRTSARCPCGSDTATWRPPKSTHAVIPAKSSKPSRPSFHHTCAKVSSDPRTSSSPCSETNRNGEQDCRNPTSNRVEPPADSPLRNLPIRQELYEIRLWPQSRQRST